MPYLEYTQKNRAGAAVLCQLLLNWGTRPQKRREGRGEASKVPSERVTTKQHLIFIAYSNIFPLLQFQDENKGTRHYVLTFTSQLQASFFQCPLRLHLHSTFQANISSPSFHQVENMLQRCNTASTSNSAVRYCQCSTFLVSCLKQTPGQPAQSTGKANSFALKIPHEHRGPWNALSPRLF